MQHKTKSNVPSPPSFPIALFNLLNDNSYHHLEYTYTVSSASCISSPGLRDTPSPAFSPLLFLYHSLKFAGSLWALAQAHLSLSTLSANFISHGCNYYIYVPTEPFFQVPGSDVYIQLTGWLHLDCPTGTSDLTYLKSSKFFSRFFGFCSFLKKFAYFQDFLRTH